MIRACLIKFILACTALFVLANVSTALADDQHHSNRLDTLTDDALNAMLSADWSTATNIAEELVESFPDFALGQLILAETHMVSAASEPLLSSLPSYSKKLIDLLLEAQSRAQDQTPLQHNKNIASRQLPAELVQIGKHIDHVVLVDLESSFLYLYDTQTALPRLIKKHYISSGNGGFGKLIEGDLKTPLGVYRIHGFRNEESLPSLYGSGALMLNYPNALDRSLGRTGSGIWLHGNPPNNRSRSPRSSEGCVTMANDHLLDLYQQINLGRTTVILSHNVQMVDKYETTIRRDRIQELFDQYRKAWVDNSIVDLMAIYAPDALPSTIRYTDGARIRKVRSSVVQNSALLAPDGINLNALAKLRSTDISLILNPNQNDTDERKYIIMEFELKSAPVARVTLYWEKNTNGFWQVKREHIDSDGA